MIKSTKNLFSVTKNQTIITISYHTKYSIAYFFPEISLSEIKIMYSPLKHYHFDTQCDSKILESLSLMPKKYILIICGNRSGKGAYRACRMLNSLIGKHEKIPNDIKVIILGVTNPKPFRKLVKNNPRFIFQDYIPSGDLEILYENAHLFLYPTLNEGFGAPPLEAMKYGTLCACSANSAVTEICGDAVLYFNPYDETEMCIRILQSFDTDIRNEKIVKMKNRFEQINKKQNQDLDLLVKEIIS